MPPSPAQAAWLVAALTAYRTKVVHRAASERWHGHLGQQTPQRVCYWTKGTSQDSRDYPFGFDKDCLGNSGTCTTFNARFASGGKMGFMSCTDDEGGRSTSMSASTGSWQHVCYTYDGSSLKVYVYGILGVTWSKSLKTVAASSTLHQGA